MVLFVHLHSEESVRALMVNLKSAKPRTLGCVMRKTSKLRSWQNVQIKTTSGETNTRTYDLRTEIRISFALATRKLRRAPLLPQAPAMKTETELQAVCLLDDTVQDGRDQKRVNIPIQFRVQRNTGFCSSSAVPPARC